MTPARERGSAPRRRARSRRLEAEPGLETALAARRISLSLDRVPLRELFRELAGSLGLELVVDEGSLADQNVTLRADGSRLGELLEHLEVMFPIRIHRERSLVRVEGNPRPRLSLLVYPLPGGLVTSTLPADFDSLRQLSFISRSQREGDAAIAEFEPDSSPASLPRSHLEAFLARLPELLPWPEGSAWHLDRRQNVLFLRSTAAVLNLAEECLDRLTSEPTLVEIETRFMEVSEDFARELGMEFQLNDVFAFRRNALGEPVVGLGPESGTRFGSSAVLPGGASGLRLSVLGILSQPRFDALLRMLETSQEAEVLSAPAVTTVNNSRSTIAVTTNLPFIEDYRPVFDTTLISQDGLSASDANVALVAVINDRNFTGIVLNVTPSVGAGEGLIQLRLQPVVRDQVDTITISNGALVEGVATPAIARPIIETRFIDTQMAIADRATVVLGGLKTSRWRTDVEGIPVLQAIPLVGRLFRREVKVRQRRDLIIFVTARIVDPHHEGGQR